MFDLRPFLQVYDTDLRSIPNGLAGLLVLERAVISPDHYKYIRYQSQSTGRTSDLQSELIPVQSFYGLAFDAKKVKDKVTQEVGRQR